MQLLQRHCLNPGSSASPAFQLRLQIPPGSHWQAGDILEVGPCHAPAQIDALLRQLGLDGEQVQADGHSLHWHLSRRQLPAPEQLADCRSPADLMALPRLAHRDYSLASLPADLAAVALALASHSRHPLSRALAAALAAAGHRAANLTDIAEVLGQGMDARWQGRKVALRRPESASGMATVLDLEGSPAWLIPFADQEASELRTNAKRSGLMW